MTVLLNALPDLFQIAHETQMPHQEPVKAGGGGGASTVVIVAVVASTLATLTALLWLKTRTTGRAGDGGT